ncbi:MAG TPA: hypothetical protein VKO18_20665, partial [Terriglobia bacterium]|nr:hypothetical protein [Terriglobia bacterium]
MQNRRSPRRTMQPVCEALESRELLSAVHDLSLSSHPKAVAIHTPRNSEPAPTSILNNLTFVRAVSTVPAVNGDLNPYGVAFVPRGFLPGGNLNPG